ncbi:hypothetical protein EDB85DRAFT_2196777 [Lactarius pseudohatsudake]|nr:hypothetical protein EDB85DRAFT_2196777 [Lactarius pseudohatsudake]
MDQLGLSLSQVSHGTYLDRWTPSSASSSCTCAPFGGVHVASCLHLVPTPAHQRQPEERPRHTHPSPPHADTAVPVWRCKSHTTKDFHGEDESMGLSPCAQAQGADEGAPHSEEAGNGKGKEGTKGEDEEEDEEEEVQEEDGHFDAPLPSSEPRVDTCRLPLPLSLPHWGVSSTFGLELQLELGYDFPSPTDSCASSSGSTTTAPRTPVTPMTPTTTPLIPRSSIHFPGRECMATEPRTRPATVRADHVRRDPRARGRFRTLSASITARSPLSLSFPISFSLPLAARRASSPNVTLQRYMMGGAADREDREGEDPFGTHGSGYYAPGEWAALGHGDAYDLSAWAWACDRSPHRRAKKRMRAATVGSASVYSAPVHAASAPQLTYAQHTDGQLEHSRGLANASAGVAGEKRSRVVRMPMPTNTSTNENETAAGSRRGMRPLLLPQKLGLLTIGAASGSGRKPECEAERADSSKWEIKAGGWDVDLERGVCRGQEVAGT